MWCKIYHAQLGKKHASLLWAKSEPSQFSHFEHSSCQIVYRPLMIFILSDCPSQFAIKNRPGQIELNCKVGAFWSLSGSVRVMKLLSSFSIQCQALQTCTQKCQSLLSLGARYSLPHSCVYTLCILLWLSTHISLMTFGGSRGGTLTWGIVTRRGK